VLTKVFKAYYVSIAIIYVENIIYE